MTSPSSMEPDVSWFTGRQLLTITWFIPFARWALAVFTSAKAKKAMRKSPIIFLRKLWRRSRRWRFLTVRRLNYMKVWRKELQKESSSFTVIRTLQASWMQPTMFPVSLWKHWKRMMPWQSMSVLWKSAMNTPSSTVWMLLPWEWLSRKTGDFPRRKCSRLVFQDFCTTLVNPESRMKF